MLKVKVQIIQESFGEGVVPLAKEFVEEDVMVLREEDMQYVLLFKSGVKRLYSKTHYNMSEM